MLADVRPGSHRAESIAALSARARRTAGIAASRHAGAPRRAIERCLHSPPAWHAGRGRADRGPADFAELLLTPGVGARTVESLAMVAEVVHGAPYRFEDPARFSLAHGGKDRHPYPVPIKVYDETIRVLKSAVQTGQARP